jgi:hypothetical protein
MSRAPSRGIYEDFMYASKLCASYAIAAFTALFCMQCGAMCSLNSQAGNF